jgi:hypothetical protein
MRYVQLATSVAALVLASACASSPPPNDKVAASAAAIRGAGEVGAGDVPQAALYLQMARDEFEQGRALMRHGDNHEAAQMLMRSQADGELALALARESKTRASALQAIARVQALRTQPNTAVGGGPTSLPDTALPVTPAPAAPAAPAPAAPAPAAPTEATDVNTLPAPGSSPMKPPSGGAATLPTDPPSSGR